MVKNSYIFEKFCKDRLSVPFAYGGWGFGPQTPVLLLSPVIATL